MTLRDKHANTMMQRKFYGCNLNFIPKTVFASIDDYSIFEKLLAALHCLECCRLPLPELSVVLYSLPIFY